MKKKIVKKTEESERERGFFKRNYLKSWNFLAESKKYLIFVLTLFSLSLLFGYIFPVFLEDFIKKFVESVIERTKGLGLFQLFLFIFQNNLLTAFIGILFGVFFAIFPIALTLLNGYVLGFISSKTVAVYGISVILRLVPHGIFELPSLIISLALGVKLGTFFFSCREKTRGFLSFLASLLIFITLSNLASILISSLFVSFSDSNQNYLDVIKSLGDNSLFLWIMLFVFILIFIFSVFVGMFVFSEKERKLVKSNLLRDIENSLRVFIFVVLPLLIIAAIIESLLILLER